MKAKIVAADIVGDAVPIHLSEGTSVIFDPDYLYARQHDNGNQPLAEEEDSEPNARPCEKA